MPRSPTRQSQSGDGVRVEAAAEEAGGHLIDAGDMREDERENIAAKMTT